MKVAQLEDEKKKIRDKQKMIKEKERKLKAKCFEEIGRLSFQANIFELDQKALLGAFLEIYEKSKNESVQNAWKETAEKWLDLKNTEDKTPLSISFADSPSNEIKDELRNLRFKWNNFRGEYYGYGNKEKLNEWLVTFNQPFTIEVIN